MTPNWGALTLVVGLVVAGCSESGEPAGPIPGVASSQPGAVAVRPDDLPVGLRTCGYSGTMEEYLAGIGELNAGARESVGATWQQLQGAGATAGHVAVLAETPGACEVWVTGDEQGSSVQGGSRIVSTVVAGFADPAGAEAAYQADIFKQSLLPSAEGYQVTSGPDTGLGPNSIRGFNESAPSPIHQVVWQRGSFIVFLTSRNLTTPEVEAATTRQDGRITER